MELYRNCDRYLIRDFKERFDGDLTALESKLTTLQNEIEIDRIPDPDRARIHELDQWLTDTREFLADYNETFVEREIHAHDDLFTDINDVGHDLTLAQRRAVVRNDSYNQVIAAAGTGKTLVLTYRIAYLVNKRGIDPNRIVALTYTKKATEEMADRLEREFGITDVEVRTLHSFGYRIARKAADRHLDPVDSSTVESIIQDIIRMETEADDSAFKRHYYAFLVHFDDPSLDETDFETKAEYVAARREQSYTTLRGETVKSQAEKMIADFLFTHQVEYQYESLAEWAETDPEKGAYTPDFYLPEYDVYIEHWGLDKDGEVAPWFSWTTEEYREKLYWAREQFENHDYELVETYEFEREAGQLERALESRLRNAGVPLDQLPFEEFIESVFDYNAHERTIIETFQEFITRAKQYELAPDEIPARLDRGNPRQYHFGQCGAIMLQRYNERLAENDLIDFADMISRAAEAIHDNSDRFRSQYDHILVDEFQDISPSQLRLLQAFVDGETDIRLFCVGDDWQSIYSFRGAEVEYFVDFSEYFERPTTTRLTANYRCPETVLEAGNALIANNATQIEKEVVAATDRDTTPQLHTLDGYSDREYVGRVRRYTADLVENCIESGSAPADVMVLCRYDAGAPYVRELKAELERRQIPYDGKNDAYRTGRSYVPDGDDSGVDVFSIHQAKGREAKHVIVMHVATGIHGFPSLEDVDELIAPVVDMEVDKIAEERRLFYVALTRAEEDLHVLTRAEHRSPFVDEVEEFFSEDAAIARVDGYEVGDRIDVTARVQRLWDDVHPKQHQAGLLEDQSGTRKFVSWRSDEPPTVVPNLWYQFEDLRIDEYRDEIRIVLDRETTATRIDCDKALGLRS